MELGSDNTDAIRPGWPGWFDVIRGLRHNPVHHYLRRLRTRRYLRIPWYRRNLLVLLVVGLLVAQTITVVVTDPRDFLEGADEFSSLFVYWSVVVAGLLSYLAVAWLLQAVYHYVHGCLGLLADSSTRDGVQLFDDNLAISTMDDRRILAGGFWTLYREVLPAVLLASLSFGFLNVPRELNCYLGYAPGWLPDWLGQLLVIAGNVSSYLICSCLGAFILGLALIIVGCNLRTKLLPPVTAGLLALGTMIAPFRGMWATSLAYSGQKEISLGQARMALIAVALILLVGVVVAFHSVNRFRIFRTMVAYLIPLLAIAVNSGLLLLGFFGYATGFERLSRAITDWYPLLPDMVLTVTTVFDPFNIKVSLIPLHHYALIAFDAGASRTYLYVAWWYFPVVTAVQLLLVAGLARFAAAAVALRRKAVE